MHHEIYLSDNYVTIDFEGTNLDRGSAVNPDNKMVLAVWREGEQSKLTIGGTFDYARMIAAVEAADFVVAHNAKHELQWLQRMGVDISKLVVFDTLLAEYVLSGNRGWTLGLGDVCKRYNLPTKNVFVDILMRNGVCPSVQPVSMVADRCALDVWVTEKLFLLQRELLKEQDMLKVLYTRCWLTPVLADIEFNGMHLDAEVVKEEFIKESKALAVLEHQLDELTGGINPKSSKQVSEYLYDVLGFDEVTDHRGRPLRTSSGGRGTSSEIIMRLEPKTPEQTEFLRLKKLHAATSAKLSKTLEFCMGVCDEKGGIFYGQFNQSITRTHRLSSSGRPIKFEKYPRPKSVNICAA